MITIQELLFNRGLTSKDKIKLVRHKDQRFDLYDMYLNDRKSFLEYQSSQSKDVFKDTDYIVVFIGEEGILSRFIGVFKVNSVTKEEGQEYKYDLSEVKGFEDLKERVIIKWKNPRAWYQGIKNEMEVVQIHPGLHYKQFKDYTDFILSFKELEEIYQNEYPDWKKMLSAANCIYLIYDKKSKMQYIGSTYGAEGIWGRWKGYAKNGHGGNKKLKELLVKNKDYKNNFEYTILMLLPKTITKEEAIKKESLFKRKLGTRTHGLNSN